MFMALAMGGTMGVVMLGWMLNTCRSPKANLGIVVASVGAGPLYLDRSQATVEDDWFMSAMIPHHSMVILRVERAQFEDVWVCRLAVEISGAQRREILETEWLIDDIERPPDGSSEPRMARRPSPARIRVSPAPRLSTTRPVPPTWRRPS